MGLREAWLADYDHEMASTRRLLERLPEDRLEWAPHPKSMTLAGLATHVSNLSNWAGPILQAAAFDLDQAPPPLTPLRTRDAIVAFFDESAARARAAMDRSEAEYAALWSLKRGGTELFVLPRATALRTFVLHHLIHHRGQLTVYLRLNDISLPAIYGPTADEPGRG